MTLTTIPIHRAAEPAPTFTDPTVGPNGFTAALKFIPSRNGHAAYKAPEIFNIEHLDYPVIQPVPRRLKPTRPESSLQLSEKRANLGKGDFSPYKPERFKLIKMAFRAPRTFEGSTHELDKAAENRMTVMATEQLPNVYSRVITKVNNTIPIGFDSFRSPEEHEQLAKRFPMEKMILLGSGSYGNVYLVEDTLTQQKVAIKVNSGKIKHSLNELVKTTRMLSIPHVLPLEHFFQIDSFTYALVFKLFTRSLEGSMAIRIPHQMFYSLDHLESFFRKFLECFAEMHRRGLMYCDAKEDNTCASVSTGEFYLFDFGRSAAPARESDMWKLTPNIKYEAPEVTLRTEYSFPADIFNLGCIFFKLLTNIDLFKQVNDKPKRTVNGRVLEGALAKAGRHLHNLIQLFGNTIPTSVIARSKLRDHFFSLVGDKYSFLLEHSKKMPLVPRLYEYALQQRKETSPERFKMAWDLMISMVDPDPTRRPTAAAALKHPFLQSSNTPEPLSASKKDLRTSSSLSESDGSSKGSRSLAPSRGLPESERPPSAKVDDTSKLSTELSREKPERREIKHLPPLHPPASQKIGQPSRSILPMPLTSRATAHPSAFSKPTDLSKR